MFRHHLYKLPVSLGIESLLGNVFYGFIVRRKMGCISLRSWICGSRIGICLMLQASCSRSFCGALFGCWRLMGRGFWGRRMWGGCTMGVFFLWDWGEEEEGGETALVERRSFVVICFLKDIIVVIRSVISMKYLEGVSNGQTYLLRHAWRIDEIDLCRVPGTRFDLFMPITFNYAIKYILYEVVLNYPLKKARALAAWSNNLAQW